MLEFIVKYEKLSEYILLNGWSSHLAYAFLRPDEVFSE